MTLLRQNTSWIELANTTVKITDVLASIGIFVPAVASNGTSKKISCPFGGIYHSDGGMEKTMRVFHASNSVFCFRCTKRYDPVSLTAELNDCSFFNAAMMLLEDADLAPKSLEQRWAEAVRPEIKELDLIALADALKIYCSGICSTWVTRQLDPEVGQKLNACLELLPSVKSSEGADKWLTVCKQVMRKVLEIE